jgi:hypothetical protein
LKIYGRDGSVRDSRAFFVGLVIFVLWWNPPLAAFAQAGLFGEPDAAPTEAYFSQAGSNGQPQPDSLHLQILNEEIIMARLQLDEQNLFHRLLPSIHLSASYGVKDILFYDPASGVSSFLLKDAYRLTLSLSVFDIFSTSKYERAAAELRKLLLEREIMIEGRETKMKQFEMDTLLAENLRTMLLQEIAMKEDIVRFDSLRFIQGKIDFDVVSKSRLDLLNSGRLLVRLDAQTARLKCTRDGK